jgi:hypothetical protein
MSATTPLDYESLYRLYQELLQFHEGVVKEKEELKAEVAKLQLLLHKLTKIAFGGKSEKQLINSKQLALDLQVAEMAPTTNLSEVKKIEYIKTTAPKKETFLNWVPICSIWSMCMKPGNRRTCRKVR